MNTNKILYDFSLKPRDIRQQAIDLIRDLVYARTLGINEATELIGMLINCVVNEPDSQIRIDLLDALNVTSSSNLGVKANWGRIEKFLSDSCVQDEIESCIYILGNSGDKRYQPTVEKYLTDNDEAVRTAAEFSLRELAHEVREN